VGFRTGKKKDDFFCYTSQYMSRISPRWILIIGLAYVFAFFGVAKFLEPIMWIGWMPSWLEGILGLSREMWLQVVGATEILLALLLLVPKHSFQRIIAVLMALHLLTILSQAGVFNDVGVRDTGLLFMAVSVIFL